MAGSGWRGRGCPFLLAVLISLALSATASARHNGDPYVDHYVRADGSGLLIANPGGHPVAWGICPADGSPCSPHDDGDGDPQLLAVRDEPPGTVFTATQEGVTARSEPWRGRVRATAPPGVQGEVRVGGLVRPLAATWAGGWGREDDWLQLQVCGTPGGADCVVILDEIKFGRCRPGGGRLLPARYEGRWLRVVDVRIARAQPFTQEGYTAPEWVRPNVPGPPGIAGAVLGRVARGPAPAADCGGQLPHLRRGPRALLPARIRQGANGRFAAASVTCPTRCRLVLTVRQRGRSHTLRRTLAPGRSTVALPRTLLRRLRSGPLKLRATVEGTPLATRRARLTKPSRQRRRS